MGRQAKDLHEGSPEVGCFATPSFGDPSLLLKRSSHMCLSPDSAEPPFLSPLPFAAASRRLDTAAALLYEARLN